MNYLIKIFKEFKYELLLIYFYMLVAQLLFLTEPYVIGKMIDGLIVNDYYWLYLFIGIAVFENFFIYRRMLYDTKIYTTIYNQITFRYLKKAKDEDASTRIARVSMSNEIITFLEDRIYYYISSILVLIGSLIYIFSQHPFSGFVVVSCLFPIIIIVYFFYNKIEQNTVMINSHFENRAATLTENNESKVDTFFKRRRKLLILGSTLQGKNWTALNSTKTVFLIVALIFFTQGNKSISQGETVTMFTYINQFLNSLLSIPVGVNIFVEMKDVINRIKE